jgi:hypothetical protein
MVAAILIKGLPKLAKKGWKTLTTTTKHKSELRLKEINKKLEKTPEKAHIPGFTEKASVRQDVAEEHAQEVFDIYAGKWKAKK